ncbi:glycosyltransferase family 39 protein [Flindersiella endophytica]
MSVALPERASGEPEQTSAVALAPFAIVPVGVVVVGFAGLLTALSNRYGFHRDELYFIAAGSRPDWGYVDQPPLTPLLARLSTLVFGDSPVGLRVVATLCFALMIVLVALIARELGGGRLAQTLAAVCLVAAGFVVTIGHLVATASFDMLLWLLISWLALRLLRTRDPRWWLAIGAAVGVGVLNKYLVGLLVVVLVVSLLTLGPRGVLRTWWLAAGVAVCAVIVAPNLVWQAANDWPQFTVAGGISADDGLENRIGFVPQQIVFLSPLLVPVWIAGLVHLWRAPSARFARVFGLAYPLLCVVVLVVGGKPYYALPLLILALAAGCVPLARWFRRGRRTLRIAVGAVVFVLSFAMSAVIALPVLPLRSLNSITDVNPEQGEQVGWPELVTAVAAGWSRIPADERSRAVIFTQNYGQAAAIEHFGPAHDLPTPYSGHMSYADWGPPPASADGPVLLVRQRESGPVGPFFTGCQTVARVDNGVGVENQEQGAEISLCSGTTSPWATLWPQLRHFY